MTEPAFDIAVAGELLDEVGRLIAADRNYDRDWSGLTLVAVFNGGSSIFGYLYQADGEWEAEIPAAIDEVTDTLAALRDAMRSRDGQTWAACKLTVVRPDLKFHAEFEYDDADRWRVSPANLMARVEELRPRSA